MALTALFLIGGFWFVYQKPTKPCQTDCCASEAASRKRKVNISVMWAVATFSVAMAAYPPVQAMRFRASHVVNAPAAASAGQVVLAVKGMDCEVCGARLAQHLKRVRGVIAVRVDYPASRVIVSVNSPHPPDAALLKAVSDSRLQGNIIHKEN